MRIAVVGAGAIGGFLAAALARSGVPVAIIARGAHLSAIERDGLRVESDLGSFTARVEASDDVRALGNFDVLLLTFKAHQWPGFFEQMRSVSETPATIVTLQNGLPFWYARRPPLQSVDPGGEIGKLFGDDRIIGGVVHVSGQVVSPGLVRQTGGLRYILGEPAGGVSSRVTALVDVLRTARLGAELDTNVRATVWLKLVNNSGLNSVSVLRRATIKPMLADPEARAQVRALMMEALRVGQAMKVVSDVDVDARIDYAARLDDVKTSMLQDHERGRDLEVQPILGAVIELAGRYDVPVPNLRDAYAALQRATTAGSAR